jgi:2-polyprenyl-6-methoxyphenol hydroxylase-like FAD-dependent oxidoreductase
MMKRHEHAVIVGGGYAGLLAARVLADHFQRVTVFESDEIAAHPHYRKGTPQSRHGHTLLARGAQILEELFPGLRDELTARGAPVSDWGQFPMLWPTGWSPVGHTGLAFQTFTRPLLESSIRQRVLALPRVTLRDKARVEEPVFTGSQATGVRLSDQTEHSADLVVIADGRHSRLPAWLATAGFPEPRTLRVEGRSSYTSRLYKRSLATSWQGSLEPTLAPTTARGGVVIAVEDDQWLVCMLGANDETAPTDPDGFDTYAASLANPHIRAVVQDSEPLSPIYRYAGLGGFWHRYDRLHAWPSRLVVLGDALCSLNPVYGQGMTVAAAQAQLLGKAIDRWPLDTAGRRYQRHSRRTLLLPWFMSTSLDQGWNPDSATGTAVLAHRMMLSVLKRIPDDPDLYRRFLRVQHMVSSPLTLLLPSRRRRQNEAEPLSRESTARSVRPPTPPA